MELLLGRDKTVRRIALTLLTPLFLTPVRRLPAGLLGPPLPTANGLLGLIHQNRRLFRAAGWGRNKIAIELFNPERRACASPGRHFSNEAVMVSIMLLIDKDRALIQPPTARHVYSLPAGIKVDAVHAGGRREIGYFLSRVGIHDDHFGWRPRTDEQALSGFVKCGIAGTMAGHRPRRDGLSLFRIDDLNLVRDGNKHKKPAPGFVQQQLRRMSRDFDSAIFLSAFASMTPISP